jgi:ribonuclease J
MALGGLGEVGMNCLVLEAQGRLLVVDCGLTFPDREPGIDVIHPDFDYLLRRADDIAGVVITHGHEDHIGALPYLLRDLDVELPVYGPPYALALIQERLREFDLALPPRLVEAQPRERFVAGPFNITPYRVTHSIPDSTGLVIRVPGATIVHSGDFKIDEDPIDDQHFDADLLAEVGREGVRLLLSDSTNSEVPGTAGGERPVADALDTRIAAAEGRVLVSLFASNVQRLGAVLSSARSHGRRVLLLGRSLQTHARVAEGLHMLPYGRELFVNERDAASIPARNLLVLATGSQGEPGAALRRLALGTHQALSLQPGDEVVLSSRVIPGRERQVQELLDALERRGLRVYTRRDDPCLHVSGHACHDEQQHMIELTSPRGFIPVHGNFVHLSRHAALARSLGVPETLIVENGKLVEIGTTGMRVVDEIAMRRVHIQQGGEISVDVLKDRARMAESGVVVVSLTLGHDGRLIAPPDITTRGVVDDIEIADLQLVPATQRGVARALGEQRGRSDDETVELATLRAVRRVFRDALGWRPVVHTVIRRTDQ